LTEEKIKFIINSPLTYIHDLKVSDYASLYFKKNQFVKFKERPGLSADNAGKNEQAPTSQLKQEADYFLHQELADGLLCFKQKKYDACIVLLNKVNDFNKTDVNCDFYLGMSYYYKKNYAMSLQHFDACVNNLNNSFLQEAMYYKALSLLGQGSKKEARDLLIKIIQEKEFYSEKARVALEGL
jgi:tetratricopeptide (TPR) repeat protein